MTDPDTQPRYRIGTVARMTGISTHALRKWQVRYGAVTPARSDAGSRLYSEADVNRLRLMKKLVDYGHSIGDVAARSSEELDRLLAGHRSQPTPSEPSVETETLVDRYLTALGAMDVDAAERLLSQAALGLEPRAFVMDVLAPLLQQVGERWFAGELCVAHEHASSAMVRNHLGALLRLFPAAPNARVAVCTTPQGELHEFGALLAAIMMAMQGWRALYLGPNLPAHEIVQAARMSGTEAVLLSVVTNVSENVQNDVATVARQLPPHVALLIGGRSVDQLRPLHDNVRRLHSLVEIDHWLDQSI